MRLRHYILLIVLLVHTVAQAQQTPRVGYVFPAGGKSGNEFQVTVGGQFLNGVHAVHFSYPGLHASVIEHIKPLTQQQVNTLREELQKLREKRESQNVRSATRPSTQPAWTTADEQRIAEIRKLLMEYQNRTMTAAISETVTLQVKADAGVEPGKHELRLITQAGLTNPLVFEVAELSEMTEKNPRSTAKNDELRISIPQTVNGRIMPGDIDRIRFKAVAGQRIVAVAHARELIPYLPDAVPGWFQATLTLLDAAGDEIAYADDYRFSPDPVLSFRIPADGEYILEIKDSIFRGREDFVYRIAIGELPFVTSIFPLGASLGDMPALDVRGWNLPPSPPRIAMPNEAGVSPFSVRFKGLQSNEVLFAADDLPDRFEKEPNNQPAGAQAVTLPIVINGRIASQDDDDVYRIEGRGGQQLVAEVSARRLGSPLDSILKLTDAAGKRLAISDDCEDKGAGLTTHHADSCLATVLPADGEYFLSIGDTQHSGGTEYAYRLRISEPRPDFVLRSASSGINLRQGATIPLTILALRRDGFAGEIQLRLKDAPSGVQLTGGRIPAGQDRIRVTITAGNLPDEPIPLQIIGVASIAGKAVSHPLVPAEDMMQAFAYRHLVPSRELLLCTIGRGNFRGNINLPEIALLKIPETGSVVLKLPAVRGVPNQARFELSEPPEGIVIVSSSQSREGLEIHLRSDGKVKAGSAGNLIVAAYANRNEGNRQRRNPDAYLPAIPFEIVSPPQAVLP